jgi:hypothetical protein
MNEKYVISVDVIEVSDHSLPVYGNKIFVGEKEDIKSFLDNQIVAFIHYCYKLASFSEEISTDQVIFHEDGEWIKFIGEIPQTFIAVDLKYSSGQIVKNMKINRDYFDLSDPSLVYYRESKKIDKTRL